MQRIAPGRTAKKHNAHTYLYGSAASRFNAEDYKFVIFPVSSH